MPGPKALPLGPRIASKVQADEAGCWLWQGKIRPDGYGVLKVHGQWALAHRLSYEHHVGPIPAGLDIDHLCRVRCCVNPRHLEPVTNRENLLRSPITLAGMNAAKTHCQQGHEFNVGNTYVNPHDGGRRCRTCIRDGFKAWRAKKTLA